jgi:hypothetical protein
MASRRSRSSSSWPGKQPHLDPEVRRPQHPALVGGEHPGVGDDDQDEATVRDAGERRSSSMPASRSVASVLVRFVSFRGIL